MWVIEGNFRNVDNLNTEPTQQRWLRPAKIYSIGRDAMNDFSFETPKTLSRCRAMTLDLSECGSSQSFRDGEDPQILSSYRLNLTNQGSRTVHLSRQGEVKSLAPGASLEIMPSDQLVSETAGVSKPWARFLWVPVDICFSALSPTQRQTTANEFKSSGLRFTEARFPSKNHTHFLPKPFRPTLPVSYALMAGIQIVCESWVETLVNMTKSKPISKLPPRLRRTRLDNETEETFRIRLDRIDSLRDPRYISFSPSDFELDFKASWLSLTNPELILNTRGLMGKFASLYQDASKWKPNPNRDSLFLGIYFVLLTSPDDEDRHIINQLIHFGQGKVFEILPDADDATSESLIKEIDGLKTQQAGPPPCIFMKSRLVSSSASAAVLFDQLKTSTKTIDDLMYSIYNTDASNLVDGIVITKQPADKHPENSLLKDASGPKNASGAQLIDPLTSQPPGRKSPLPAPESCPSDNSTSYPRIRSTADGTGHSTSSHCSATNERKQANSLFPPNLPAPPRRNLIRRAGTRTDEVRFKELEQILNQELVDHNGLEQLRKRARIDDSTDLSVAPETIDLGQPSNNDFPSAKDLDCSAQSVTNPNLETQPAVLPTPSRKLLKRKASERRELDPNKYMPFLGEELSHLSTVVQNQQQDEPDTQFNPPSKRSRVNPPPAPLISGTLENMSKIENSDIEKIEGPATRMLRAESNRRDLSLKRKGLMESVEEDTVSSRNDSERPLLKRARHEPLPLSTEAADRRPEQTSLRALEKTISKPPCDSTASMTTGKAKRAGEEDDSAPEHYLTVKTTGKRLTAHELETNLEFNRLRISKPLVLLKNAPVQTRRIGWNEEDSREEEMRQMDGWAPQEIQNACMKSFFKVKYVSMLRRNTDQGRASQEPQVSDFLPNFKKFKPKHSTCESVTAIPKKAIKMETVRLRHGDVEDWEAPTSKKGNSVLKREYANSEHDDQEDEEQNEFRKFTGRKAQKQKKLGAQRNGSVSLRSQGESHLSTEEEQDSTSSGVKMRHRMDKTLQSETLRSQSESLSLQPRSATNIASSLNAPARNIPALGTRKTTKSTRARPDSDSERDELAFKGFRRARK